MVPATLLLAINEQQGTSFTLGAPFSGGEQGAYVVYQDSALFVLKWTVSADACARFQRARELTECLRARGYPAARFRYVGSVASAAYTVQESLPGSPMGILDVAQLPRLLALNDLQADAANAPAEAWPASIADSVLHGYADYCVIGSLKSYSAESHGLLERLQTLAANSARLACPTGDIVHYDFTAANILVDAGEISGVIDWDGAQPGDRAFDLATLLFYAAEQPEAAALLWEAAVARSSAEAIRLYLAHMIVRQVDWSIRHHGEQGSRQALAHGLAIERRYLTVTKRRPALL